MPGAFDPGFSPGFGGVGTAQIMIVPGPHPTYQDGDILCAFNRRRIRDVHAQHICHVKHQPFNSDGLNPLDSLPEQYLKNVCQYKFERISQTEVRRTDLDTLEQHVFSSTPILVDGKMQHMHVERFIAERKKHPRHRMFGTAGAEVWYGGRKNAAYDRLTTVWNEIEARTANREVDFTLWPATPRELEAFLIVSTDDFDDATAGDLASPLYDFSDPENPVKVSKRKNWMDWRNLRDVVEADVLNQGLQVDIRGRKHVRSQIVNARTV